LLNRGKAVATCIISSCPNAYFVVVDYVHNPRRIPDWQEDNAVARVEATLPKLIIGPNWLELQTRSDGVLDELFQRIHTLGLRICIGVESSSRIAE